MSRKPMLGDLLSAAALMEGKSVVFYSSANTPAEAWSAARSAKARMQRLGAPTERMSYWPSPIVEDETFDNESTLQIICDELEEWPP